MIKKNDVIVLRYCNGGGLRFKDTISFIRKKIQKNQKISLIEWSLLNRFTWNLQFLRGKPNLRLLIRLKNIYESVYGKINNEFFAKKIGISITTYKKHLSGDYKKFDFKTLLKMNLTVKKNIHKTNANNVIEEYIGSLGKRYQLIFDIATIFIKYGSKPMSLSSFSKIIKKNRDGLGEWARRVNRPSIDSVIKLIYDIQTMKLTSYYRKFPGKIEKIKQGCLTRCKNFLIEIGLVHQEIIDDLFLLFDIIFALSIKSGKYISIRDLSKFLGYERRTLIRRIKYGIKFNKHEVSYLKQIITEGSKKSNKNIEILLKRTKGYKKFYPYSKDFYDKTLQIVHVKNLLIRQMGIELFSVELLSDGCLLRHHIHSNKLSNLFEDLFLTTFKLHSKISEKFRIVNVRDPKTDASLINELVKYISKLVFSTITLTEEDFVNFAPEHWKNHKNGKYIWRKFIERRSYYKKYREIAWFEKYFKSFLFLSNKFLGSNQ